MWFGGRPTEVQATTRPDNRRLRGIYFIDPEDDEYKESIENARRKLAVHMDAAMPCNRGTKGSAGSQETGAKYDASNEVNLMQSMLVWWNLMNPRGNKWMSLERYTTRCHMTTGYTSSFLCRRRKIQDAKAVVDKK